MEKGLPAEITWRRDKVGFEPPQWQWMQDKKMQEMIQDAKNKLVNEKILKPKC
jgi:asparagine synthase (glutamine-hydrolysing)